MHQNKTKRKKNNPETVEQKTIEAISKRKNTGVMSDLVDEIMEEIPTRKKERNLSNIVDAVAEWRRLYSGVMEKDKNGKSVLVTYSLENAAKKVGMSKKSLDDYLLQIRYGRKFGFDFDANKNKKVGVLRAFVRDKRD